MYERFLNCPHLTSGSVLKHILKRTGFTQRSLAEATGLLPQRINDFINDKRRISAEQSIAIEKALGIDVAGYFYTLQANHEIYLATLQISDRKTPNLKYIPESLFWDMNINKLDWQANAKSIIERVFSYGDDEAVQEIINFYSPVVVSAQLHKIKSTRFEMRRKKLMEKHRL